MFIRRALTKAIFSSTTGRQHFEDVRDSENAGVAIIFQELSLVKELTVGENIFLGQEPSRFGVIDWSELYHKASKLLRELHLRYRSARAGRQLGHRPAATCRDRKGTVEKRKDTGARRADRRADRIRGRDAFRHPRKASKADGVGMIYISHKLDEVFRDERPHHGPARRQNGRDPGNAATHKEKVIAAMVGREVGDIFPKPEHEFGDVALEVRDLTAYSVDDPNKKLVDDVSFSVRRGEVLGIAGLMGAGRTELLMAIFGAWQGNMSARDRGRRQAGRRSIRPRTRSPTASALSPRTASGSG